MPNHRNKDEQNRAEKFQRLLRERAANFANESYEENFAAVADSDEGSALLAEMHLSNAESEVPIQSPRHAGLLGESYPITPEEKYRRLWLAKFGTEAGALGTKAGAAAGASKEQSYQGEKPTGTSSDARSSAPQGSLITGPSYRTKEKAKKAFLAEKDKLIAQGMQYQDAWNSAASTEPGKSAYEFWTNQSNAEKAARR